MQKSRAKKFLSASTPPQSELPVHGFRRGALLSNGSYCLWIGGRCQARKSRGGLSKGKIFRPGILSLKGILMYGPTRSSICKTHLASENFPKILSCKGSRVGIGVCKKISPNLEGSYISHPTMHFLTLKKKTRNRFGGRIFPLDLEQTIRTFLGFSTSANSSRTKPSKCSAAALEESKKLRLVVLVLVVVWKVVGGRSEKSAGDLFC